MATPNSKDDLMLTVNKSEIINVLKTLEGIKRKLLKLLKE